MTKYLFFYIYLFASATFNVKAQASFFQPKITDAQGNENPVINCNYPLNGNCLPLSVNYPKLFETTSYAVESEDFKPYGAFNAGTPLLANADDLFFKKQIIPFNFCFFGKNYNEVIIGSNGIVTFNSSQLGNVSYPNIQVQNPDISLPLNSIFGVAQDLVFSTKDDSEIYYSVAGTAPFRKLVINFYKGRIVGCDQTSTSQIVLNEGTNDIEIFIDEKPLPCATAKFKESLIGIINEDGTKGYSPVGRNTGVWTAKQEAWKFKANGNEVVPQISWFNSDGKNIGSGNTVTVCPEKNEKYTAKLLYALCGNNNFELQAESLVSFTAQFPLAKNYTKILCGTAPININLDDYRSSLTPQIPSDLIFSFHKSLTEAQNNQNALSKVFQLNDNMVFYVRIQNPADPNCYRTAVLKLNLISKSLLRSVAEICDVNNDGVEKNYQLSLLNPKLFNLPLDGIVHYFKTKTDAENNQNELISFDIKNNEEFYIAYQTVDCKQIFGPITVTFISSPVIKTPIDFPFTTCDLKDDKTEPFDFKLILSPLIATDPLYVFSYFNTYAEAFTGTGSQLSTIREGKYTIYARVEIPGGCFSIATINLDITFTKVEAKDETAYICFDGKQDIDVNLDDYTKNMLIDPLVGITKTYYSIEDDAVLDVNPISNLQKLTGDGDFVPNTFFVKFSDPAGCYALKTVTINLVHPVIAQNQFDVCDFKNDGTENVNLNTFSGAIIGSQNATVFYYPSMNDAQADSNRITTLTLVNTEKLFVKIISFGCSNIYEINLKLTATPIIKEAVNVVRNSVCDNNNDDVENIDLTKLQAEIYSGPKAAIFNFYTGFNAADNSLTGLISSPAAFPVKGISTVYAQVTFADGGCYTVSTINITLNFLPGIVLKKASLAKCDYDFNLNESFNLDEAIPQNFTQSENSVALSDIDVSYFETEADANDGNLTKQIKTPYITKDSDVTVWARFTSNKTLCYSVASINLKTYLPPKALKSTIPDICDDNLDGKFEVNLLDFTADMSAQTSADNHFSFYYNESDANNKINAIADPENFSANPLPALLWVRIENIPGCYDVSSFDLKLGTKIPLKNYGPFSGKVCDEGNNGVEAIDLTQFQSTIYSGNATFEYFTSVADINTYMNLISSPQTYSFNENSGTKTIFVKISAPGFCPELVEINLSLKKTPMFTLPDYYFCPDGFIDIQPDFSELDIVGFQWLDPSGKVISTNNEILNVKTEGTYKINVTASNGCTFSTSFKVKKYEVPVIKDLTADGNTITVNATGSKTILYSKDGITFQLSNVFSDLPAGVTTFYVKFVDYECLGDKKQGLILNIRNAFSPNGDGINDTWFIDELYVFDGKSANIKIFDRYQKMIFEQESSTKLEWNGKVTGGRAIPTDNYWYMLTLPDGRMFNGWIVLKNRN
ncbi:T9SS type B sorting domain-containing protein [Halpernia frigidisoli]|uniref:Gliding motility-associated C-terminal domain-containing protein n=1 Tax=Halpernia frigidisoli TaxID=1125876 RepID=A0A1I3FJS1_9FLAO|nr:T9SS type B sorting domain-containing protein [Halpernia frigidisoli]SFI11459.1 gliding motility-associated C-terminal domain-containing protein [Halpernia frigidisoli]